MPAPAVKFYQTGSLVAGNRLLPLVDRSVQADPGRRNSLTSGHRACRGCGEALAARWVLDAASRATNGELVVVNATGCLEVFSTPYPESAWQVPWIHSLFGNAPAVASGVAAALRAQGRTDVRVLGQGGDGGTVDIGFGCLSGMFERNDDVLFVCYDNQAYMNTGVQRSGATPPAARTATTQAVGPEPGNAFGQGKNAPLIAMAHEIPYVATATVADLRDLEYKVFRAMEFRSSATAPTCPPVTRPGSWTRWRSCGASPTTSLRPSAGGWWSTAAATRRWTWRAAPAGWALPTPSWCTGAPASGCRPSLSRSSRPKRRVFRCAGCPPSPRSTVGP
jgi:pyruvate ferredoxin oxidoreductase beta subunit